MNGRELWALRNISDDELEASLSELLGAGARLEARIVAHLAEVEGRRIHLLAGYSSLYDYCRRRLALSDYEAFVRIAAARVARKYPVVFGMLERRELHLTAICEVRDFLTVQNHRDLLAEISGRTKLQIREILARRFPQADVPTSLKKLPSLEPLSPGRYRLLLTLSVEQKQKLELARDLLSHANPTGDFAVVVERALDQLIAGLEKRRFGQRRGQEHKATSEAPERNVTTATDEGCTGENGGDESSGGESSGGESSGGESSGDENGGGESGGGETARESALSVPPRRRHIRNAVRRELLERDGSSCTFVGREGERCNARAFLQIHHRHPWALGGHDTPDNLTLLCHAHNRLLAEQDFGEAQIQHVSTQGKTTPHNAWK